MLEVSQDTGGVFAVRYHVALQCLQLVQETSWLCCACSSYRRHKCSAVLVGISKDTGGILWLCSACSWNRRDVAQLCACISYIYFTNVFIWVM